MAKDPKQQNSMPGRPGEPAQHDSPTRALAGRLMNEVRQFVVMFLYLWILFGLFVLNQVLTLEQHGLSIALSGFAMLNALVLAKVMMIVEYFDFSRWLRGGPLVYPVVFESLLLSVLFIVFHFVERVVMGLLKGEALQQSIPNIAGGGPLGLICIGCILLFSLLPFFAFKHLSRVLGPGYVYGLFFRGPSAAAAEGSPR